MFVEEAQLWWDDPEHSKNRKGAGRSIGNGSSLMLSSVLFHSILERSAPLATSAITYSANLPTGLSPIKLSDFMCRRLVCATNAQLVAEKHLIRTFWPIWNMETKACWGMSKHGDSAGTRKNKRSPWAAFAARCVWPVTMMSNSRSVAMFMAHF